MARASHPTSFLRVRKILQASIRQIRELLDLSPPRVCPPRNPPPWTLAPATDSLDAVLADRLLWLPEVSLSDSGLPTATGLPHVAPPSAPPDWKVARASRHRFWIAQQDYRFVERFVAALPRIDRCGLQQRSKEALGASRARSALPSWGDQQLDRSSPAGSGHRRRTAASLHISLASLSLEEVRNFKAKLAQLDQIQHEIRRGYQRRCNIWAEEQEVIADRLKTSHIAPELQREALAFVAAALERKDVRVVIESLGALRGA